MPQNWLDNVGNSVWSRMKPNNQRYPTNGYNVAMTPYNGNWSQYSAQLSKVPLTLGEYYARSQQNLPVQNVPVTNGYSIAPPTYTPSWTPQATLAPTPQINQALTQEVPRSDTWKDYAADAGQWGLGQLTENVALKGLTGKSLGDWALLGARKVAPKVGAFMVGGPVGEIISWTPEAYDAAKYLLSTPTAKTIGRGIKHAIDWVF